MRKRVRSRRGQSILEYLVIATVIVGAVIGIKTLVEGHMNNLYTSAAEKTGQASSSLAGLSVEGGTSSGPGPGGPGPGGPGPGGPGPAGH